MLLLAPHPDDLAFSIGGWLAAHVRSARILTLFSRSRWCPFGDSAWGVADISAVRAAEDARFAERRGLSWSSLDFDDTSVLGVPDCGNGDDDARAPAVREAVARAAKPGEVIVAPGGLGGHVDHLLTRRAAEAVDPMRCIFYEDLPYAASLERIELPGRGFIVDVEDVWAEKLAGLAHYGTQVRPDDVAKVEAHARRVGAHAPKSGRTRRAERLWAWHGGPAAALLALTASRVMV